MRDAIARATTGIITGANTGAVSGGNVGDSHSTLDGAPATRKGSDLGVPSDLITPREVASLFCVNPKTVTRWAVAGRLTAYRTLGGHRRYSRAQIEQFLGADSMAS